jgi:hypothetical protein
MKSVFKDLKLFYCSQVYKYTLNLVKSSHQFQLINNSLMNPNNILKTKSNIFANK